MRRFDYFSIYARQLRRRYYALDEKFRKRQVSVSRATESVSMADILLGRFGNRFAIARRARSGNDGFFKNQNLDIDTSLVCI